MVCVIRYWRLSVSNPATRCQSHRNCHPEGPDSDRDAKDLNVGQSPARVLPPCFPISHVSAVSLCLIPLLLNPYLLNQPQHIVVRNIIEWPLVFLLEPLPQKFRGNKAGFTVRK